MSRRSISIPLRVPVERLEKLGLALVDTLNQIAILMVDLAAEQIDFLLQFRAQVGDVAPGGGLALFVHAVVLSVYREPCLVAATPHLHKM